MRKKGKHSKKNTAFTGIKKDVVYKRPDAPIPITEDDFTNVEINAMEGLSMEENAKEDLS